MSASRGTAHYGSPPVVDVEDALNRGTELILAIGQADGWISTDVDYEAYSADIPNGDRVATDLRASIAKAVVWLDFWERRDGEDPGDCLPRIFADVFSCATRSLDRHELHPATRPVRPIIRSGSSRIAKR